MGRLGERLDPDRRPVSASTSATPRPGQAAAAGLVHHGHHAGGPPGDGQRAVGHEAGKAARVRVTLTAAGTATLYNVRLALQLPQGWTARPPGTVFVPWTPPGPGGHVPGDAAALCAQRQRRGARHGHPGRPGCGRRGERHRVGLGGSGLPRAARGRGRRRRWCGWRRRARSSGGTGCARCRPASARSPPPRSAAAATGRDGIVEHETGEGHRRQPLGRRRAVARVVQVRNPVVPGHGTAGTAGPGAARPARRGSRPRRAG